MPTPPMMMIHNHDGIIAATKHNSMNAALAPRPKRRAPPPFGPPEKLPITQVILTGILHSLYVTP